MAAPNFRFVRNPDGSVRIVPAGGAAQPMAFGGPRAQPLQPQMMLRNNGTPMAPRPAPATRLILDIIVSLILLILSIIVIYVSYFHLGPLGALVVAVTLFQLGGFRLADSILQLFLGAFHLNDNAALQEALRRSDTMKAPNTVKVSESASSEGLSYGFSCMQGWRRSMEDDHTLVLDKGGAGGFFAVFDGHCGRRVASICGEQIYTFVQASPDFAQKRYSQALRDGFVNLDKHIFATSPNERSGCTANALYISPDGKHAYCANAGDSRCVLSRNGEAFALSDDHKPYNIAEQQRIMRAGSTVRAKRVDGILALSRAIGDFAFKQSRTVSWVDQAVTSNPDIMEVTLNPETDEFAVVACDGIWDVKSNEEVILFVRQRIKRHEPLTSICEQLMMACLSTSPFGLGCDNMSVVIVTFNQSTFIRSVGGANTTKSQICSPVTQTQESAKGPSTKNATTSSNAAEPPCDPAVHTGGSTMTLLGPAAQSLTRKRSAKRRGGNGSESEDTPLERSDTDEVPATEPTRVGESEQSKTQEEKGVEEKEEITLSNDSLSTPPHSPSLRVGGAGFPASE